MINNKRKINKEMVIEVLELSDMVKNYVKTELIIENRTLIIKFEDEDESLSTFTVGIGDFALKCKEWAAKVGHPMVSRTEEDGRGYAEIKPYKRFTKTRLSESTEIEAVLTLTEEIFKHKSTEIDIKKIKETLDMFVHERFETIDKIADRIEILTGYKVKIEEVDKSGLVSDYAFIASFEDDYTFADIYYLEIPYGEKNFYITEVSVDQC